jgi:hypothetical protein
MHKRSHIEARGLVKTFRSPEGPDEAVRDLDLDLDRDLEIEAGADRAAVRVYRRDTGRM